MHGYLTPVGDYYETFDGPADPADRLVPLRPSEAYAWDDVDGVWVLHRERIAHRTPRPSDAPAATLADLVQLVHEMAETMQYQHRATDELRRIVGDLSARFGSHLNEAAPVMEALRDLQSLGRAARVATRIVVVGWRLLIYGGAMLAAVWALAHGDLAALKRAVGLIQ